jgi:cell division protein FtsZ
MYGKGIAHMGIGQATGDNRATEAAKQAIKSPLLETSIEGAKSVLLNITGGADLGIFEVNEAADLIRQAVDQDANIIFGAGIDEGLQDEIKITVIATGFEEKPNKKSDKKDEKDGDIDFEDPLGDLDIPTFLRRKDRK